MPGPSLNEHHLVPKSLGGREKYVIHKTCHQKIHSVFTEKELEKEYHTFERLLSHPEMNKFVRWVKKQPAESVLRSRWTKERRK
ncbi:MAG: HNH endonuclease [Bdellovibrionia bacterium]